MGWSASCVQVLSPSGVPTDHQRLWVQALHEFALAGARPRLMLPHATLEQDARTMTQANSRNADYPIDPLFLERWSPRAFTDEPISERIAHPARGRALGAVLVQLAAVAVSLRAARHRAWPQFLGLCRRTISPGPRTRRRSSILVSKTTMLPRGADKEVPSPTHSLDAGAAWANLALQAARSGWAAHGMAGFDVPRTAAELAVPTDYRVEAAIAIGRPGDKSLLPESLRAREQPSDRLPLSQLVSEGRFPINPHAELPARFRAWPKRFACSTQQSAPRRDTGPGSGRRECRGWRARRRGLAAAARRPRWSGGTCPSGGRRRRSAPDSRSASTASSGFM